MSVAQRLLVFSLLTTTFFACSQQDHALTSASNASRLSGSEDPRANRDMVSGEALKADSDLLLPEFQDLAIVIPRDQALILAIDMIPESWVKSVEEALANSEIDEDISDENYIEDWRLVSMRVSPCSPLGHVADREEIDRLCWPGVRLVFQPIIKRISILGIIRDYYADDRAIHALYRLGHEEESLAKVTAQIKDGVRLTEIDPELLERFELRRDQIAKEMVKQVMSLRLTGESYTEAQERPEFYDPQLEEQFIDRLIGQILVPYCQPQALHELTSFSLPLGRNPASAELWSFVAFSQENDVLKQTPILVKSRIDGSELFRFEGEGALMSEDVTTSQGDYELELALDVLPSEVSEQLEAQVIVDTKIRDPKLDEINDPYQTLVSHTTCSSCHRANLLNFDFHNFSYFEDNPITISPRTIADVERDREWVSTLLKGRTYIDP